MTSIVAVAKVTRDVGCRLAVSTSYDLSSPVYSPTVTAANGAVRLEKTGLSADTQYYCGVEIDGVLKKRVIGHFKTPASGAQNFNCAFSGDADTGESRKVFDSIIAQDPLFFLHLGDMHYEDVNTASLGPYRDAWDAMLKSPAQRRLYRKMPIFPIWDDHDYCGNDTDGSETGRDAAVEVWRERLPHPGLVEAGPDGAIYYSFEVGRVVFIVTDLRSEASPNGDTDDASKTMMGSTQKTWFKNILSDAGNSDKLFVWVCSRNFQNSGATGDGWGAFSTERTELCDYIQANCSGRLIVVMADIHFMGIDDGTNHDFVTSGSEPIPTFMAAPLWQTISNTGSFTFSEGIATEKGQFGTMEITDAGGSTITVDWVGRDEDGNSVLTHSFNVSV